MGATDSDSLFTSVESKITKDYETTLNGFVRDSEDRVRVLRVLADSN